MAKAFAGTKGVNVVRFGINNADREARVCDFAMITLVIILNGDEPIAKLLCRVFVNEFALVNVGAKLAYGLLNAGVSVVHVWRVGVEIDEDETTKYLVPNFS